VVQLKAPTSETIETLNERVSVRDYNNKPLDDATVLTILNAARRTATSSNTQTYSFIVVRDSAIKQTLAVLAGHQKHIETCPVFIAVCADITKLQTSAQMHEKPLAVNLELSMVSIIDAAIAGQSAALAAESLGLGTVMIGGMRNYPQEVAEVLGLPDGVFVVYGLCVGWFDDKPLQKPRLPQSSVIHFERYTPTDTGTLRQHDRELAEHYHSQGRRSPDAAWTGVLTDKFTRPQRSFLRKVLEKRGFRFD
jgi:FMN reductase (NADPH)